MTAEQNIAYWLDQMPFRVLLDDAAKMAIAGNGTLMDVEAGSRILDEEQPATTYYLIFSGTLKQYKLLADGRRQITGFTIIGDVVGDAIDATYSTSVEAVTPCVICRIPRAKLLQMAKEVPGIADWLITYWEREVSLAASKILLLGRKTAIERVSSFFLRLSYRSRRRQLDDNPITVAMSRTDIADFLGLTTETVSRTITQLKTHGFIRLLPNNKIHLSDVDGLQKFANGEGDLALKD